MSKILSLLPMAVKSAYSSISIRYLKGIHAKIQRVRLRRESKSFKLMFIYRAKNYLST